MILFTPLQMHEQARYHEMLFISDTCQAASLYGSIQAPHILSMASSKIGNIPLGYWIDSQLSCHCQPVLG